MDIEKIVSLQCSDFGKLSMILSNNIDVVIPDCVDCVSIKNVNKFVDEILYWHNFEIGKLTKRKYPSITNKIWRYKNPDNKNWFKIIWLENIKRKESKLKSEFYENYLGNFKHSEAVEKCQQ